MGRPHRRPRRAPCAVAALAALASLVVPGCGDGGASADRPNVVLIVVDTLRADAILDPEGKVDTPSIDALARDGVLFPRAFTHAPMTLPAHTALFASRPPVETGVLNNGQKVPPDVPLVAEWMEEHGYQTRAVLSLGTLSPVAKQGLDRGFEDYDFDFWQIATAEDVMGRVETSLGDLDLEAPFFLFAHFSDPHEPYSAHGTVKNQASLRVDGAEVTTLLTSELDPYDGRIRLEPGRHAIELVSSAKFVVPALQVFDPKGGRVEVEWEVGSLREPVTTCRAAFDVAEAGEHRLRLRANDSLSREEVRRRYAREVEYVDRHVGRLLDELRAAGVYDDTIVVFTSDHGEALGEHGFVGHVEHLFDEMLHVPLIVKPQDDDAALRALQRAREDLVTLSDLVPTVLALCRLPELPGQRGTSLLGTRRASLIAQTHKPEAKRNLLAIRDERYKLIHDPDAGTFELYDLAEDPAEKRDVFPQRGAERADWQQRLRELARLSAEGGRGETGEETLELLRGLGYAGAGGEPTAPPKD